LNAKLGDLRDGRIHLPPGAGKKRNGWAAIPDELATELLQSASARRADPGDSLLAPPRGEHPDRHNVSKRFQRCVALALVKEHWPAGVPEAVHPLEVALRIVRGRVPGIDGRKPKLAATKKAQREWRSAVERLAVQLEPGIRADLDDLYLYRLRHTHQTWAEIAGVQERAIDIQIGHAARTTGTRSYRDLRLMDAAAASSADVVWKTLQAGLAARCEATQKEAQPVALAAGAEGQGALSEQELEHAAWEISPRLSSRPTEGEAISGAARTCESTPGESRTRNPRLRKPETGIAIQGQARSSEVVLRGDFGQNGQKDSIPRSSKDGGTVTQTVTCQPDPDLAALIAAWPRLDARQKRYILKIAEDMP